LLLAAISRTGQQQLVWQGSRAAVAGSVGAGEDVHMRLCFNDALCMFAFELSFLVIVACMMDG
jgi:hypothetical protein